MAKRKDIVKIKTGIVYNDKTKKSYESLNDAIAEEARCGCGYDCCSKEFRLRDKTTDEIVSLYFDNGGVFVRFENGEVEELAFVSNIPDEG